MGAKAPDFKDGQMLPGTKYRIVRQIGAGGMGVVYQVVKPPEIQGVLKLMSSDLTQHEEFRTRFLDEVRVLAQIDHPNIVKVFDYDTLPDGTPFYVMELLHGRTVRDVLATMGTLPPRVAFEVTRQLCEALHCAHTHDIPVIHRDIKPENIFLHAPRHGEPQVKLIDFGVIAVADRAHDGAFVGTWKYAAPEQIRGERATPATDIYAVGLVLYEMLSGIGPFEHLDSGSLVSQAHLREIPPPVSKFAPWVPPSIVQLIAAALAKEPRQRPRDAYAFAERLFELEWANDGKDPNDRTSEGPLSRILSTVNPSSRKIEAAAPKDRLGNVPVVGVPHDARHGGPTIKGVGGPIEATSPDVDALLAGFSVKGDAPKKKARESGPSLDGGGATREQVVIHPGVTGDPRVQMIQATPRMPDVVARPSRAPATTMDAPPSASAASGASGASGVATQPRVASTTPTPANNDTDTFSSQESDTRRLPKRGSKLVVPVAIGVLAVIGGVSFLAYRGRTVAPPVVTTTTPPIEATGDPTPAAAPVATAAVPAATTAAVAGTASAASATRAGGRAVVGVRGAKAAAAISADPGATAHPATAASSLGSMPVAPAPVPVAPAAAPATAAPPAKPADTSFVRGL